MQAHPSLGVVPVHDAEVGHKREPRVRSGAGRELRPCLRDWKHWGIVVIRARRLVFIGERIPVTPEAHHAHVHLTAATYGWYVAAHGAVKDGKTLLDDHALLVDGQPVLEPDRAISNGDGLARPRGKRQLALHRCYMIFLNPQLPSSNVQASLVGGRSLVVGNY